MKKGIEKEKEKEKEFPCAFGYDAGAYHGQLFFTLRIHAFVGRCDDSENDRAWRCTDTDGHEEGPRYRGPFNVIRNSFTWQYIDRK